jgi:dTDP-4-dehydrorhamnose 3,5-epimerase-like enzyme
MNTINSLALIDFPKKIADEANLYIYETQKSVPFEVKRVFTICAKSFCERGFHAHKGCSQLLVVLFGSCTVICDDGSQKKEFILTDASQGLLIPPTVWAHQVYEPNTVLMVLTDQLYDENDYLRNYAEFLEFRKSL